MTARNREHNNPQIQHDSPFFEQELFVEETEPEWEAHLAVLEEESLWRDVFTQRSEFSADSNFNRIKDSDQDRFLDEEAWLGDDFLHELDKHEYEIEDDEEIEAPYSEEEQEHLEEFFTSDELSALDEGEIEEEFDAFQQEGENQLWESQGHEEELYNGEYDAFEEVREADDEWEEDTLMDEAAFSEEGQDVEPEIWAEADEKYETYSWEESYPQEESAFEEEFFGDTKEAEAMLENPVELELRSEVTISITAFITQLGIEWAQKRQKKSPSAEEISNWLLKDYKDTLEGARLRYKKKYGKGKFTVDAIGRAWMISRREQMNFVTSSTVGIRSLQNFAPPTKEVSLISSKLIDGSDKAPVAPIIVRFVEDLQSRYQGHLRVTNYLGHGGGKFNNRGYSLDLWLKNVDDRGFYVYKDAINLLRAVDQASNTVQSEWRMIYNDFSVADAINRETGKKHVIFVGKVRRGKNRRVTGLNWHGPAPLILHFHLDLAPRKEVRDSGKTQSSDPVRSSTLDYQKAIRLNRHYGRKLGWQNRLHEINNLIGLASNTPINRTFVNAVTKWQKTQGLTADGILGPNTWSRMRSELVRVSTKVPQPKPSPVSSSPLRQRIVEIAEKEWVTWGKGTRKEDEPAMHKILRKYWLTVRSDENTILRAIKKKVAWSAAFVSWVMKEANTGKAFRKSSLHAAYVLHAKQARENSDKSKFWAYRINEAKPELGDVVVHNRCKQTTFDNVGDRNSKGHLHRKSHGDIVVDVDVSKNRIKVIGGNVSNSVGHKWINLDPDGYLPARTKAGCKYIAILKVPDPK